VTVPPDPQGRLLWDDDRLQLRRPTRLDGRRPVGSDGTARRFEADPERVEQGMAQLVLTIVELLRQLMERQALRRVEAGSLTDEQEERLGVALMRLADAMTEMKEHFGLDDEDLNLHLGPLGDLL
jgi:hypothetical protein